jgi:hypothetical protein
MSQFYAGGYLTRLTQDFSDQNINQIVQAVIAQAAQDFQPLQFQGEFPLDGFGIAVLRAKDVALTNNASGTLQSLAASSIVWGATSIATASVWQDWLNITLDTRLYIANTGIFYPENAPIIEVIRPKANGIDLPALQIEELQTYDVSFAFYERPFGVRAAQNFTMRVVASASKGAVEHIGLLGYTIAKKAYLISE